jgi:hypothetical protein
MNKKKCKTIDGEIRSLQSDIHVRNGDLSGEGIETRSFPQRFKARIVCQNMTLDQNLEGRGFEFLKGENNLSYKAKELFHREKSNFCALETIRPIISKKLLNFLPSSLRRIDILEL